MLEASLEHIMSLSMAKLVSEQKIRETKSAPSSPNHNNPNTTSPTPTQTQTPIEALPNVKRAQSVQNIQNSQLVQNSQNATQTQSQNSQNVQNSQLKTSHSGSSLNANANHSTLLALKDKLLSGGSQSQIPPHLKEFHFETPVDEKEHPIKKQHFRTLFEVLVRLNELPTQPISQRRLAVDIFGIYELDFATDEVFKVFLFEDIKGKN